MKTKIILSIILALGVLINLNAQSYPPDGWRVKMAIASTSEQQKFSEMVVKNDDIHTIWIDNRDGNYRVYYKKSTDAGFTWSTDIVISESGDVIPDAKRNISITGVGNYLYVVYATKTETPHTLRFCRSTDYGTSWSGYQDIDQLIYNLPEPSITADDDSIRLVFRQGSYIVYTASGDHGNSWSSFDAIDAGGPYPECCPDIATIDVTPHVAFVSNEPGYGYVFHATHTMNGWVTHMILSGMLPTVYYYPHILSDQQGYVYVEWEDTLRGPSTGGIKCFASTDGGESWDASDLGVGEKAGADFVVAGLNRLLAVFGDANYAYGCYGNYSPGVGIDWESPFILEDISPVEPPACKPHCCIAKGNIAKHLIFHPGYGNNQDLGYMANDDLLLSDTPQATAFNSATHLVRDIFCGGLHLVYQSQGRVHYSYSNDGGTTWAPYHILEDPLTQQKEDARYPSIGLNPGFFVCDPCVVYIDNENQVKYRYRDLSGDWQGFTILPYVGLEPGPPALATYGGDVFVAFSVMSWLGRDDFVSAVLFYQFSSTAYEPPEPDILDQANDGRLYGSNVSITIDGNGDPHVAWSKKLSPDGFEDIFYRWRDNGNWQDIEDISDQADAASIFPHLDDYGDWLAVVWKYDGDYEIWRRRKYLPENAWAAAGDYSQQYATCAYPVNAGVDFSVWCETPVSQSDIRYRSDTYGWGWVSQAQENEYYCHSQLQRDWYPWDLYTIFTKGDEIPYRVVCVHQQFGGDDRGAESPLYQVETGKEPASAFCVQRDRAIDYGSYSVDYASQELIYDLCFLESLFPFHKIRGTIYFEGGADKTHEILVNGKKEKTIVAKPDQTYDFDILIPRELYQVTPRVTVSIKNPANDGVYLSGLKVFRSLDGRSGGGPQSTGSGTLGSQAYLVLTPNPFREKTHIAYCVGSNAKDTKLQIYDVAGRVVKSFRIGRDALQSAQVSWDGRDDRNRQLPNGIYFIELKSGNQSVTEKVIKMR